MRFAEKKTMRNRLSLLLLTVLWNELVYYGGRILTTGKMHAQMEMTWEKNIPFLPWTVIIYLGCFIFWGINYFYVSTQEEAFIWRFFSAEFLSKVICFFCFIFVPTTNIRPVLTDNTIWDKIMKLLYSIDAADNLFPSIHCLCSWFSFIAVRKRKDVFIGYRVFSFLFAMAVCISTMTTKQHVFTDVISGVLLAEFCYQIVDRIGFSDMCRNQISVITNLFRQDK